MIVDAIFEAEDCSADEHGCCVLSVVVAKLISSHKLTLGHFRLRGMSFSGGLQGNVGST